MMIAEVRDGKARATMAVVFGLAPVIGLAGRP